MLDLKGYNPKRQELPRRLILQKFVQDTSHDEVLAALQNKCDNYKAPAFAKPCKEDVKFMIAQKEQLINPPDDDLPDEVADQIIEDVPQAAIDNASTKELIEKLTILIDKRLPAEVPWYKRARVRNILICLLILGGSWYSGLADKLYNMLYYTISATPAPKNPAQVRAALENLFPNIFAVIESNKAAGAQNIAELAVNKTIAAKPLWYVAADWMKRYFEAELADLPLPALK